MPALRENLNLFARRFALALHHATRVRLGGTLAPPAEPDADMLRASGAHLPGAGWIVGLAACISFALVALALRGSPWSPAVAATGSMMATALLTGARYESALFRAGERLGAGGIGTLVLVLVLVGKVAVLSTLASLSEAGLMSALFAGHVVSRFALLLAGQWLAGENGHTLRIAALWCVVPLVLMFAAGGVVFLLIALAVAALGSYAMLRSCRKHPEIGVTDGAAAVQQACELAFYLGAAIGA